jgi:flagellar hook protein FlgE
MALTALFTGSSGLQANSTALDVVGNNLANLNTTGYKTQRTLFKDQVYQLLNAGSAGDAGSVGGQNSSQLGFGVSVGSVDTQFVQGAVNPTGRPLDAGIQGSGFFVLRSQGGQVFSRAGAFGVDSTGFLVDPSNGARVQRTGTVGEPTPTAPGFQVPADNDIRVPFGAGAPGVATTAVRFQGNISRDLAVGEVATTSIEIFDTQSGPQPLTVQFTKSAVNTYTVSASIPGATVTVPPTSVTFNTDGTLQAPASLAVTITGIPGAAPQTVTLNLGTPNVADGLTQFGGTTEANAVGQDGSGAGVLTSVSIDNDGFVQGQFSNGRTIPIAQLAIAGFNNEGGLIRTGDNNFVVGPGSGPPFIGTPGTGGRGLVQGSALEGASVDIAIEFSRLILAQRGFQVNARTISAANETLQELANIVR